MTTTRVRDEFDDTLDRVSAKGDRIILRRGRKDVAALVPMADLALLREIEDRLDNEAADKALAESDERIPYEQVRKELGLAR